MLNITRRDIEEAHSYARDAMRQVQSMRGTGENVVGNVVKTMEVAAGAMGVGVLTGRFGPLRMNGNPVPLDLAAGVAMHLLGFMGLAGKHADHLHNFGDGVLAGYLTKFGVGYGTKMRADAKKAPLSLVDIAGEDDDAALIGGRTVAPLSVSELTAMAQAVR